MTRETRIALLVGLAFIVLFGLVLGQRSMNLQSQSPTLATNVGPAGAATVAPTEGGRTSNEVTSSTIPDSAHNGSAVAPAPRPEADAPSRIPADAHVVVVPDAGRRAVPAPSVTPAPTKPIEGAAVPAAPAIAADTHRPGVTETPKTGEGAERNVINIARTDDSSGKTYKVEAGDTIFKIAKKLNLGSGGPAKIMAMNKDRVKDVTALKVGQDIMVPADDMAKVTSVKADAGKNYVAANLVKAAGVKKPVPVDVPVLAPGGRSALAIGDKKPADDKPVLSAINGKGDVDGTLTKLRDDMKTAVPGDKTGKSTSLDKLDDKLNGKADPAVASKTYKVRPGDSFYSIAGDQMGSRTKAAVQKLMQANGIKDPSKLATGSELKIPKAS